MTNNRYPFNKKSSTNISLAELSELFSNEGILNQFFIQNIRPLVNTSSYPWKWKNRRLKGNGLSDDIFKFFETVDKINSTLFQVDDLKPSLRLFFKPIYLSSEAAKVEVNYYGKRFSYQFGRSVNTVITLSLIHI